MSKSAFALAAVLIVTTAAAAQDAVDPRIANDPRMAEAMRHANARADLKCGIGIGTVDLATRNQQRACRRRIVNSARLDAESEIGAAMTAPTAPVPTAAPAPSAAPATPPPTPPVPPS